MPYQDAERVAKFYTEAFGWNMQQMDEKMGNYVLAGTTETAENMMPKTPGSINGGFYNQADAPGSAVSVVISVDNLDEAMKAVETAGGKIEGEKMEIPGIGTYARFVDSEGNRVGMLQPAPMA